MVTEPRAPAPAPAFETRPLRGIALKVLSVLMFLSMATCIKRSAPEMPTGQAVFFRSVFALPPILAWLVWQAGTVSGMAAGLRTDNPIGHLWRGLAGSGAMGLGFLALGLLPLSEAVAIGYATPLLVTVLAALFLGERIRAYRISAVLLGLIGVIVVLWPRLSQEASGEAASVATLGAIAAISAALLSALAQVLTRRLVAVENVAAIVFWFTICSAVLSLLSLPFGWRWPDASQAGLLVAAGLFGGLGQILLTSSYRHAELAVIAPFEYTSLLFALLIGWTLFDEVPTGAVLGGAALVIVAGCSILWREHRLGIERRKARALLPPQG